MIRRSTWIAIGGLGAVVILALVLTQSGRPEAVLKPTPVPQALWSVPADEIAAITIEDRGEGRVLEFERSAEELWKVTRPVEGPADVAQVEQAASWLTSPSPRAQIYNVESVEQFGLVSPAYRIRILLVNGTQLEFSVGRETPTGGSRYVISPGIEGVVIISSLGLDEVLDLLSILDAPAAPIPTPEAGSQRAFATQLQILSVDSRPDFL